MSNLINSSTATCASLPKAVVAGAPDVGNVLSSEPCSSSLGEGTKKTTHQTALESFHSKKGPRKDNPSFIEFERESGQIDDLPGEAYAFCLLNKRKIFIDEGVSIGQSLVACVFELTNAVHTPRFEQLNKMATAQDLDCEENVKETERVEFEGTLIHRRIFEVATEVLGWDKSLNYYADMTTDFEQHYLVTKTTPHADAYRKLWEEKTGKKSLVLAQKHLSQASS